VNQDNKIIESFFCGKPCNKHGHMCTKKTGHTGRCSHTEVSRIVKEFNTKVGAKLQLDSYSTPGNNGAAKNRADRCYPVQYTKQQIREANTRGEHGVCIPKRFASTPYDCFIINIQLAIQVFAIADLPVVSTDEWSIDRQDTVSFLQKLSRLQHPHGLRCRICGKHVLVEHFITEHGSSDEMSAQLGHIHPYINGEQETAHVAGNTQWIHRDCNIIQGEKTEKETFQSMIDILENQGYTIQKGEMSARINQ